MRWKNSLAFPIIGLLLVLASGMGLAGYYVNTRVFYGALEERENDKLNSIQFAIRSIVAEEVKKLSTLSKILNDDKFIIDGVSRYRETGDLRPLQAAMDRLYWQMNTQIFLVTDPKGVVIYRANNPPERGDRHDVWGFEEAGAGAEIIAAAEGPRGWAVRALAPIRAGKEIVGVLILGTRLDQAFAGRIARETGTKISFANLHGVLASSSPAGGKDRGDLATIRQSLLERKAIFHADFDRYRSVRYEPLKVVDETFCLVLENDLGVLRAMLHRNKVLLAKAGALLMLCVMVLGTVATMILIRPLKELQAQAREVIREFSGQEKRVPDRGNEIATLGHAIRLMVETVRNHVAERGKADLALRRSEEQFRQAQKMEAVGRLAGGVAHDFNNLLTVITGYSELLLSRLRPEDPARREIGEIRKAGERAASLTRQLLAFSRRQVLQPKVIALNDVVGSLTNMLRRLIGEDIDLVTALEGNLWNVIADPNQVEQVLMNLVVNARDAMPRGGTLRIATANATVGDSGGIDGIPIPAGEYARVEIADTGCGMDEPTRAHIFEPFFTTKEQGKGTGLGLATVYGIVKQSGGFIRVVSAPGEGTTFEIYFPRAARDATAPAPEAREEPHPLTGRETVLVVEDEEMVREMVCEALRESGYEVLQASNGEEALSLCGRHTGGIDLMLTDLVMPRMNGIELARRISPLRREMRILYMTGHSEDAVGQFGRMEDGSAFLNKPVTPRSLSRKVREVLAAPQIGPPAGV